MAFLSRDVILNCDDLVTQEVDVPEWGGTVVVRSLTGKERDSFEASIMNMQGGKAPSVKYENLRAKLVLLSVVDPTDYKKPMFQQGDLDALGGKDAKPLDRIFTVAQKLSGISADDVEEMTKN